MRLQRNLHRPDHERALQRRRPNLPEAIRPDLEDNRPRRRFRFVQRKLDGNLRERHKRNGRNHHSRRLKSLRVNFSLIINICPYNVKVYKLQTRMVGSHNSALAEQRHFVHNTSSGFWTHPGLHPEHSARLPGRPESGERPQLPADRGELQVRLREAHRAGRQELRGRRRKRINYRLQNLVNQPILKL